MISAELDLQKLPPQNIEAEQMVLGAVLIENGCLDDLAGLLTPDDFYRDTHHAIFAAMLAMHERRTAIDLLTLTDALGADGTLAKVGGTSYLSILVSLVPTSANAQHHARIVRDKSTLRRTIRVAADIIQRGYEDPLPTTPEEFVDRAEQAIFAVAQRKGGAAEFVAMPRSVQDSWKQIEELYDRGDSITGVASGFPALDDMTSGFQPGDLVIIAARPSVGKTAFALNLVEHAALDLGKSVAVFSLEMAREQLVKRMIASQARVNLNHIRTGRLTEEDWGRMAHAAGRLRDAPVYIDDAGALSALDIRARSRRLRARHGVDLLVVDYLQLMRGVGGEHSREQEVSGISRALKALAKELQVPIIALSQLNRALEQRVNKRPGLSDLRESGALEQDSDLILFLYREEAHNKCECGEICMCGRRGAAEVNVGKQRNGPTGVVHLKFVSKYTRFENQ